MPDVLALTRAVSTAFRSATTAEPLHRPLDRDVAAAQHAAVMDGLRWLGAAVEVLPGSAEHPDCCFVEDTAVVLGDRAIVTRSGNASRRGEVGPIEARLVTLGLACRRIEAPGTLDGGDVLIVGGVIYVGLSRRTNAAGAEQLLDWLGPAASKTATLPVPPGSLHLKCGCSSPAPDTVLVEEGPLVDRFAAHRSIVVPATRGYPANAVGRDGRVLVAAGFPEVERRLREVGLEPRAIETSELRRADGAITCLSLRLGPGW